MKKILSIMVVICMALSLFAAMPAVAFAETEGVFTYTVENGEATITGYDSSADGDVIIPNTLGGYPVTSIGVAAFMDCTSLTSVTIPDSVTIIGGAAFQGCTSLTSVTIPDSITSIGNYAFMDCKSLTSVTIPDSVTSIGDYAFYKCTSLTSVTIGNSVTSIGLRAFYGCESLTNISVADNNKYYSSVNGNLFNKNKTELIQYAIRKTDTFYAIPDSVTTIGNCAFAGCTSLTSVTIPDSVTTIGFDAFRDCTSLTSVTIPDSVTTIGFAAFTWCYSLTSVTIPDSVTTIGHSAFAGCTSLTSVTIPDSVTSISNYAFESCTSLTSVTIPDSVTTIGYEAFESCKSLTSVTIPDSVTTIDHDAFSWCDSLTSVTIPDSVTTIGYEAFEGCKSLTSVTIPDSVTTIGERAFYYCTSLKDVHYGGNESQWNKIDIGDLNHYLTNANIHYNYKPISVLVNSKKVVFDQQPIIEEGRTLVPLRAIFEALGAQVDWEGETQTVKAVKGDTNISLKIGSDKMYVNGNEIVLDVPAKIENARTLVPVRAISESFGLNVFWDGDNQTVTITE